MKIFGIKIGGKEQGGVFRHKPKKRVTDLNPHRDWKIVISTLFVLLLIAGYFNVHFYKKAEEAVVDQDIETVSQQINMRQLEDVIGLANEKMAEFVKYTTGEVFIADPSK